MCLERLHLKVCRKMNLTSFPATNLILNRRKQPLHRLCNIWRAATVMPLEPNMMMQWHIRLLLYVFHGTKCLSEIYCNNDRNERFRGIGCLYQRTRCRIAGVEVLEDTIRKYNDSEYFSSIIGYTGKISTDEYNKLSETDDSYTLNDVVGKLGIEQYMDSDLKR